MEKNLDAFGNLINRVTKAQGTKGKSDDKAAKQIRTANRSSWVAGSKRFTAKEGLYFVQFHGRLVLSSGDNEIDTGSPGSLKWLTYVKENSERQQKLGLELRNI